VGFCDWIWLNNGGAIRQHSVRSLLERKFSWLFMDKTAIFSFDISDSTTIAVGTMVVTVPTEELVRRVAGNALIKLFCNFGFSALY
jgi:hypothetical protein